MIWHKAILMLPFTKIVMCDRDVLWEEGVAAMEKRVKDKVLKWQSGAVWRPCREAESVDELFIPVGSGSHPHTA